jgi:SLT domain-containing protein
MTAIRMRDVVDADFVALADRAASEAAYRLGGAYRALRGVRPGTGHRMQMVVVAGVAGFVGVMAVLTARRWTAKVAELIRAMEDADRGKPLANRPPVP